MTRPTPLPTPTEVARPPGEVALRTADGERLAAQVLPGPGGPGGAWAVLAHGFSGSRRTPGLRLLAQVLSSELTVLTYDARGHGRSTGRTTLGGREVLDVDAAVAWARSAGAGRVATVGFSMGAAAVVRHAAGHGRTSAPDAVVAVGGTSAWSTRSAARGPVRRLHLLVETAPGRAVTRALLRTRVDPGLWPEPPVAPLDCVAEVGVPLLVVHGDRDAYFGLEHARAVAARAGAPLWVEPGGGHAEAAMTPDLAQRLRDHLVAVLG